MNSLTTYEALLKFVESIYNTHCPYCTSKKGLKMHLNRAFKKIVKTEGKKQAKLYARLLILQAKTVQPKEETK